MSHTYVADCSDSKKEDDTLIIIVNSDGTLSVDPGTLQKILASQHHNSPISLVRLDAKNNGSDDSVCEDDDDDPDSRVNLTVEGYYPPTPAPSSPTPPPTPVSESSITADGGGPDVLADSITEILQPEDVEKLETALQSEHAKEILGDVVLDMLQKNEEEDAVISQQGSVVLDHCYASLSGPTGQLPPVTAPPVTVTVIAPPTRGTGRGRGVKTGMRGRGAGSLVQSKLSLTAGASMVPVVKQLIMPSLPVTTISTPAVKGPAVSTAIKSQATIALQRVDLQQGPGDVVTPKPNDADDLVPKKKGVGRGRGSTRGQGGVRGRGGRGRGISRITKEEEEKNKILAEEMAATVRAITLAETEQLNQIESLDQSSDADRVIPLVNKVPTKKPVKVYKRAGESGPKGIKVIKPEKIAPKPKGPRKSTSSESSSHEDKPSVGQKKDEKVIVVSTEPQITPAALSAVAMSQNHLQTSLTSMNHVTSPTSSPAVVSSVTPTVSGNRKNYPKRENRKPPAHLVEAFGPALFSTPDIIRRVSTDKPSAPSTPSVPGAPATSVLVHPATPKAQVVPLSPPATALPPEVSTTSKLEDELGLTDSVVEPDSIEDTINTQVSKQEDQLLAEALLLEDLSALPTDEILQERQGKKPEIAKKAAVGNENRKSTDSKKSTESRKSLGRFMICCDFCEDWFHGKCVGITKAMGEQMEEQEIEWMCPKCKKKKKQEESAKKLIESKGLTSPKKPEVIESSPPAEKEKKIEASKVILSQQKLVILSQDVSKNTKGPEIRITKIRKSTDDGKKTTEEVKKPIDEPRKSTDEIKKSTNVNKEAQKITSPDTVSEPKNSTTIPLEIPTPVDVVQGMECLVCKRKETMEGGVYCSDNCIGNHVAESLALMGDKSAFVVFERKTGRIYGGPNAPTASTLAGWIRAHPSYEVMRPSVSPTSKYYNQQKVTAAPARQPQPLLRQTILQTRPQGIQLIAALPQPPPIEGPMKKNLAKSEPVTPIQKAKPQTIAKGQQQITSLLKPQAQQSKPETVAAADTKTTVKTVVTSPPPAQGNNKKLVKEVKKSPQAPVIKKVATPVPVKKVVKEDPKPEPKKEELRTKDQEELNVRTSVKKMLQEVLTTRLQETTDLKLSEEQVKKIATQIEEELHSLFKEPNTKYKAKYRSLMFNIKDKNNLTLFRKIADKSISPIQLVRLTPEELASQELAQWREREARHQLEMIKKTELDLMQQAKTVVMKTHKGEQIVENEDGLSAKVLETSVEIEPVLNITSPVTTIPTSEASSTKLKEDSLKVKDGKHGKKDKKDEKHKERRHSHKSHHKDHHRSRSRHRSRHKSECERRSRSKSKSKLETKPRSASGIRDETSNNKEDIKMEGRSRSKSRPPEMSRSEHFQEDVEINELSDRARSKSMQRERSKSRPRERSKSRVRERSKSSARERSKSRPREQSKSRLRERSKSRLRERSKSRPRERSKSRPGERSKSGQRERSKSRGRSKSRPRERSKSNDLSKSTSDLMEISKSVLRSRSKTRERSKSRTRTISINSDEDKMFHEEQPKVVKELNIEGIHEGINLPPMKASIFDPDIKEIIRDVVVEEEIGPEENLSDIEPSSTVIINTPPFEEDEPEKPPVWRGTLLMPDVAKFSTSIQEVSGVCGDLGSDLPNTIDCVGRISPETAWDYIGKMKKSGTKQILVVRFSADNEEDKMSYLSFYSYLSSRNRLGVVGNNSKMIKDFYILPLPSHSPVPQVLLPLDGPGFEDYRPHLLLGIIVRTRRKRLLTERELPFVPKVMKTSERSYTPPLPDDESHTPTHQHQHPATESFTPPHSPKPRRVIKLKPKTSKNPESPTVSEDFVLEDADTPYTPEDEEDADTPYSPGEGEGEDDVSPVRSPGCSAELQRKVDELNRMINDIEERKQKIDLGIAGMSPPQELLIGSQQEEDEEEVEEAYSPSSSITPPPTDSSYLDKSSSKISLPSDLQDIIASIKKKSDEPKSMDLKLDPIVQAYRSTEEPYSPEYEKSESLATEEKVATPTSEESFSTQSSAKSTSASAKVSRDPRQRPQLSLNQLSDEDIMKKASEMGFMNPENPEPIPEVLKSRNANEPVTGTEGLGEENRTQHPPLQPPPVFNHPDFSDFPPPPRPPPHLPHNFPPQNQFQHSQLFPQGAPPLPPLPPTTHIPFTNPQPPPPKPMYPPPPSQPAPIPPPPPSDSPELIHSKKKFSKKSKKKSKEVKNRKEKREKRKYSESPPPKEYDYNYEDSKFDKTRDRDRYSSKRREKRETWRTYDRSPPAEKRREPWDYEAPPPPIPPQPGMSLPPIHPFPMQGPLRGPMRGRYPRGMRGGFRRGFDRPPMRGFHRGGFHPRGHHPIGPASGPSRSFPPKSSIQNEYEEDIRRFEEQRKQKNMERRRWRSGSPPPPRKRRVKDEDSD